MNINEEPYAGKPQVRFCEGNKSSHNYLLGENYMTTRQSNTDKKDYFIFNLAERIAKFLWIATREVYKCIIEETGQC